MRKHITNIFCCAIAISVGMQSTVYAMPGAKIPVVMRRTGMTAPSDAAELVIATPPNAEEPDMDEAATPSDAEEPATPSNADKWKEPEEKYDDIINAEHPVWKNSTFEIANNPDGAITHQVIKEGQNWLSMKSTPNVGNSMQDRALLYSEQAGNKIKNGYIEAVFSRQTDHTDRFGLLFRANAQGDCWYFAYDTSGWYLQRKHNNTSAARLASNNKIMAEVGEQITARVEFEDYNITATVSYKGETTTIFDGVTFGEAGGGSIKAGKIGFMLAKYGGDSHILIKNVDLEDSEDSSTTNNAYDWKSDSFQLFDDRGKFEEVETDGKNWYEFIAEGKEDNPVVVLKESLSPFSTGTIDTYFTPEADTESFEIIMRYLDIDHYASVGFDSDGWFCKTKYEGAAVTETIDAAVPIPGEPVHLEIDYTREGILVYVDDEGMEERLTLENWDAMPSGRIGFLSGGTTDVKVWDYIDKAYDIDVDDSGDAEKDMAILSTETMDIYFDKNFPRIEKYTFKDGDVLYAQPRAFQDIKLNGLKAGIESVECEVEHAKAKYIITAKTGVGDSEIKARITADLEAEDHIVTFNILEVDNLSSRIVHTVEFPTMLMASVTSNDQSAQAAYAVMSGHVKEKGDRFLGIDGTFTPSSSAYKEYPAMYAIVSNDKFSASLWSNSELNNDLRVTLTPGAAKGDDSTNFSYLGLRSSVWTVQDKTMPEQQTQSMPSMKVIITQDINENGKVDWQDGAIAYRDIMNNPIGAFDVPNMITLRIVENFASQAAHPFLETLDGIKRTSLATDGLGQQILLKGYASEGHDSAHPDYGDIGSRIGGAEDMKTLLSKGRDYGARIGIHINASEAYPEAKSFNENLVNKNAFGWNWIDEAYSVNTEYDLVSGKRQERLQSLYDEVGDQLDFIYLDVWSNSTWATRRISEQFHGFDWRIAMEWGYINEYDTTWNHWAVDLDYGGADKKGNNSDIMRFIRNHQKDTWVGNYPAYGGTAKYPLLGGENSISFEGWQRAKDFKEFITATYNDNLPTKFLQHYLITEWENDENRSPEGNQEKKITLKSKDGTDTIVVERTGSNGRTIQFNDRIILEGSMSGNSSNEKYLIPWYWDGHGNELDADKLYHWNRTGGSTSWELPDGWKDLTSVYVYELTDQGKASGRELPVNGGVITLKAAKETPYVIYQNRVEELSFEEMEWGYGTHLTDPNFTSQMLYESWTVTGDADAVSIFKKADNNNPVLKIENNSKEVIVSQEITGLEGGQTYMAYGLVDNQSDKKAYIEVETDEGTVSNYTEKSLVRNFIGVNVHNTQDANSYMQNIPVVFTVPEDSPAARLIIRVEAGEGTTLYDELRVCEYKAVNQTDAYTFEQDFEHNVQGLYPFIVGNHQNRPTDVKVHLSEKHAPYTQRGWNGRIIDDVIDGDWSVKIHQLTGLGGIVVQTIPQTYRFAKGATYTISFDYEQGTEGSYSFAAGIGEHVKGNDDNIFYKKNLNKILSGAERFEYTFTSEDDNTWVGIYSNDDKTITEATCGKKPWKMGMASLVFDNLKIERKSDIPPVVPESPSIPDYDSSSDASGSYSGQGDTSGTWIKDDKGWWYKRRNSTYPESTWYRINGRWYAFNEDGYMITGWFYDKDYHAWFYLKDGGDMRTGWYYDSAYKAWFYLKDSGVMKTGWYYDTVLQTWFYFEENGAMKLGKFVDEKTGDRYELTESGAVKSYK